MMRPISKEIYFTVRRFHGVYRVLTIFYLVLVYLTEIGGLSSNSGFVSCVHFLPVLLGEGHETTSPSVIYVLNSKVVWIFSS